MKVFCDYEQCLHYYDGICKLDMLFIGETGECKSAVYIKKEDEYEE